MSQKTDLLAHIGPYYCEYFRRRGTVQFLHNGHIKKRHNLKIFFKALAHDYFALLPISLYVGSIKNPSLHADSLRSSSLRCSSLSFPKILSVSLNFTLLTVRTALSFVCPSIFISNYVWSIFSPFVNTSIYCTASTCVVFNYFLGVPKSKMPIVCVSIELHTSTLYYICTTYS